MIEGPATAERTVIVRRAPRVVVVRKGTAMRRFVHHPGAVLDYGVDWTRWLGPLQDSGTPGQLVEDQINSSVWAVTPAGPTLANAWVDPTKRLTRVYFSGGTAGEVYTVTNTVTTALGRTEHTAFKVMIKAQG